MTSLTPDEALAGSLKYSSATVWHFGEIRPGLFALWNHERRLQLLTTDFDELLATYRARPAYQAKVPASATSKATATAALLASIGLTPQTGQAPTKGAQTTP